MPKYSRSQITRAAVNVLDNYSLEDVAGALIQEMQRQKLGLDATLIASQLTNELYRTKGHLAAQVMTAHPASTALKRRIQAFLKHISQATSLTITYDTNPSLIGGIIISTPVGVLNMSIKDQLNQLTTLAV